KTTWWLERSKPVEYVKEKLGVKGLTGNYKLEKYTIWKLVRTAYTTYPWWDDVGLNKMTTVKGGMSPDDIIAQLKKVQKTEEFQRYKRYAIAFDDHVVNLFGSGYYRPTQFIDESATPLEKMASAQIWAEEGRPDRYVREFLGLLTADGNQLKCDQNYY
ncbi:hypothetical protein JG688_00014110, partial [Phytophthora aleatoria]